MSNEINFNDSMKRINEYLQSQKPADSKEEKTLIDVDVESIFSELKGNGEDISPEQFALKFAEDFLEKEIKDVKTLDNSYIKAWEEIATFDEDDDSISFDEIQGVLDAYRESQLPEGWDVDNGVVKTPDGKEVEARPELEEGHTVQDGKILDADGNEVGVIAEIEKDTDGDGVKDTVESYYYYKTEEEAGKPDPTNGEKAVSKADLPEGHTITDDGKILDKDGNEIGRTEVTYADGTGDGVNDKITSYYLYNTEPAEEETQLPDDWKKNEDGTITDDEGNALGGKAVQAEDLEAMGYTIADDGYIYDADGNKVGRNIATEADVNGDGTPDVAQSCYLYADTEATKPEGFPEGWTMNKDGTITDENGNVLGGLADDAQALVDKGYTISDDGYIYPPGADTTNPENAVGRSYSYETTGPDGNPITVQACYFDAAYEVQNPDAPSTLPKLGNGNGEPEVKLPEGLTKDENGKITDENGRELSVVEPDAKELEGLTEKDGEYYNEYGQKVAITGEDGTVYMYNEVPELEAVAKPKAEALPADKNYEIDDEGNIIDKDTGFKVGYVDVEYADGNGDGVNDKITSYYLYEEVQADNPTDAPSTPTDAPSTPTDAPSTPTDAPSTPTDAPSAPADVIGDDAAKMFVEELFEAINDKQGFDQTQFDAILENENLSADDWVKIVSMYNAEHGSFIEALDDENIDKSKIMGEIGGKLLEAAEAGNEDAIKLLAEELHNSTVEIEGAAEEFFLAIMDNASEDVLAALIAQFGEVNPDADIFDTVEDVFANDPAKKKEYLDKLYDVAAKM